MLEGKDLHAGAVKPFTEEETDEMLRLIFRERAKGCSVRRAIMNAAGGDEKKMLRMQNKYRNLLKKQPRTAGKGRQRGGCSRRQRVLAAPPSKQEIDALYRRIAGELRRGKRGACARNWKNYAASAANNEGRIPQAI